MLCGPNNSGKSHILKAIAASLGGKQASKNYQGYNIRLNNDVDNVRFFLSGPHWNRKDTIGIISSRYKRIDPNKPSDFRNFSLKFFYEQILGDSISDAKDTSSEDVIRALDRIQEDEFKIYQCNSNHRITTLIEEILSARLLYRKTKGNIEFILANPTGLIVPYPEWSDGQKTIFYFFLCLEYWKPDILFIDEVENHLHPLYMSRVLTFIKNKVPQTFVATHHPHVIFSEYVDQAFYIETVASDHPLIVDRYTKIQQQKTPKREVDTLSSAFAKLAATYKFFDVQDRQLLKQANQISQETDIRLFGEILDIFYPGVVCVSSRLLPDRQTLDIRSLISTSTSRTHIKILDYGSGIGRVIKEFEKVKARDTARISWNCWEPSKEVREKLKNALSNTGLECAVPEKLNEIESKSCDIVIVANVAHELTPIEFAELFITVQRVMSRDGTLLLAEIYPLLKSEKYAVPYPHSIMNDLLITLGFSCSNRSFLVRDSQAYCVSAKFLKQLPDRQELIKDIEETWDRIKKQALSSYHNRMGVSDSVDYRNLIMDLNTIASIEAWKQGFWEKHVYV